MADDSTIDQQQQQVSQPGNLVILNDGSRHLFPPGTTVDQMHKTLNLGPVKQQTNWVDTLRPFLSAGAGALSAAGASLIPGVGETGVAQVAADTQGYALTDSLLKYLGANKPKSYSEALTGSEADAAINAVAGKLLNGVFKGAVSGGKAFATRFLGANFDTPDFYKLFPTTSQALEKYGMKALAQVPKFLEDYMIPAAKAGSLDRSGGKGLTQALAVANSIDGRMAGTNSNPQKLYDAIKGQLQLGLEETSIANKFKNYTLHSASDEALNLLNNGSDHFKVLDDVLGSTDKLSKVLKVGQIAGSPAMNVKQDLAAYKFMDMINKATTIDPKGPTISQIAGSAKNASARIDPSKLSDMWNDPDMQTNLNLLYGKGGMDKIGEFIKNIAYTQQNQGNNPLLGKYLRYGSTAGKFIMGISALQHGLTTGNYMPLGAVTGIQLGASTVGRMLTNPATSKIMTDMAQGVIKENPAWVTKMIGNAVRNKTVGLMSTDGNVKDGSLEEDPNTGTLQFKPDK